MKKKKRRNLSQGQIIALGFCIIILVGTLLLCIPAATRPGETTTFLGALFTATSATCVTGLVAYDTYTHWSIFGQCVILMLIQVGGLGFMTFNVMFLRLFRKEIGLRTRGILMESVNAMQYGGIIRLVQVILKGTVLFETLGALLLMVRLIPEFGVLAGIYNSVFLSVSAFCNAGFDLMGRYEPFISLCRYESDVYVNVVITSLIIIGGLGFVVWDDLRKNRFHVRKYRLHTKMVLVTTITLLVGGTILFLLLEGNNTLAGYDMTGKLCGAWFDAVTPRTAGFNTTDTAALSNGGKLLTCFLMFIGGSPGSTAGGIKTTTLLVIIVYIISNLRSAPGCNIFGRRLDDEIIKKAGLVVFFNLTLVVAAMITICGVQPQLGIADVIFEVFSAIGTAGMSTGVTRSLGSVARIIIILLMYCGRVGSITFAMSFLRKKEIVKVQKPVERITIG